MNRRLENRAKNRKAKPRRLKKRRNQRPNVPAHQRGFLAPPIFMPGSFAGFVNTLEIALDIMGIGRQMWECRACSLSLSLERPGIITTEPLHCPKCKQPMIQVAGPRYAAPARGKTVDSTCEDVTYKRLPSADLREPERSATEAKAKQQKDGNS